MREPPCCSALVPWLLCIACSVVRAEEAETMSLRWETRQPVPFQAFHEVLNGLDEPFTEGPAPIARTAEELEARLREAGPGETVRIADGTHHNWGQVTVEVGGAPGRPVTLAPETQHGVRFTGDVSFKLAAEHVVIRGFDFEKANTRGSRFRWAIIHMAAPWTRVSSCRFVSCCYADAERDEDWGCKYAVQIDSGSTRVDHCYFYDRQGTSINLCNSEEMMRDDTTAQYLVDHNIFRDSSAIAKRKNNREAISIWGGMPHQAVVFMQLCAESNLFDYEVGDGNGREIMTVKASGTVWRHNVFANGPCDFSFRTGRSSTAYGNVLINCVNPTSFPYWGHTICGANHLFVNNACIGNVNGGMLLTMGDVTTLIPRVRSESTLLSCETVRGCVFAHNLFLDNAPIGLGIAPYNWSKPRDKAQFPPESNHIVNNIFVQEHGVMCDFKGLPGNTIRRNLFHSTGPAQPGDAGSEAVYADPQLTDDPIPRLRPDSPARNRGVRCTELPDGFYGEDDDAPDIGPITTGPYGFDRERLPHIPPSKDDLQARPLQAAFEALRRTETPGQPVLFDGDISAGQPVRYSWDFGDGTTFADARGAVVHTFPKAGVYDVALTVLDADGNASTARRALRVISPNNAR